MNTLSQAKTATKGLTLDNDGIKFKVVRKNSKCSLFTTQQNVQQELMEKIKVMTETILIDAFWSSNEEHVKQAVIESTLELGYVDLGISLLESL
jgi:hypothetical protein